MDKEKIMEYISDAQAKQMILEVGRRMYQGGFVAANDGNISCKVGDNEIWATPTGVSKGFMTEDMLVKLDLDGNVLEGTHKPSSEIKMHLRVFKENPKVQGVVHAHPLTATAFACAGISLEEPVLMEGVLSLGCVPLVHFALPGTEEVPEAVAPYCREYNAVLLANHGALTWGDNLMQAYYRMETTEYYAKILMMNNFILGKKTLLSQGQIDDIIKIRAGWGIVGNDRISNYLSMDLYSLNKYADGNHQEIVLTPKQIANYDLKWEGSTTTNIGLDLGFFDSRLNITADAFIKDTKDLLIAQNLAYVTGFGSQWQNVGKIRNSGIELSINSVNFNNRNFFWTTDFNISFVKNKLVSLRDGTSYMQSRSGFSSNFTEYDYISYVGSSLGDMYGYVYDGVYQSSDFVVTPDGEWILKSGVADMSPRGITPEPGVIRYKDITGDGKITTEDRTSIGNGYPLFYGGLTNNFQFYGFDVSIMFQYSIGNDVYNATRMYTTMSDIRRGNTLAEVADRWRENNASTKVHSAEGYIKYDISSRFIEDASYLRLKNITLGYTLPENLTRTFYVSKLRIYASAQNLFCLTNYSGFDPDVNTLSSALMPGFDWGAYPKSNVYTFGVELQF